MLKSLGNFLVLFFFLLSVNSISQVHLPKTSGFRGFVRPAFGYLSFSNNMVASFLRYDLAERETKSVYARPESQSMTIFLVPFEVSYTFAKTKTQIIFGTQLDDLIRFNLTQQVGVKQEFSKVGVFQFSFMLNGLPTQVWQDPYIGGDDRTETVRNSRGARFIWDLVFNTGLRLQYNFRRVKLAEELSGQWLGLDKPDMEKLVRNGWMHNIEILYWIKLKQNQLLAPSITFIIDDRDGEARSRNAAEFRINYTWLGKSFSAAVNSFFGYTKARGINPIYNKTQEDIYFSLVGMVFYKNPWGWKIGNSEPMNFVLNVALYRSDTNIDFYYRDAFLLTAGVLFRWAKRD